MKQKPLVSVLMAVYNGEQYLKECIESILNQTYANFELIIVNDGSTDGTPSILQQHSQKDPRIRIITQENTGLTIALNNGAKQAKGELIARQDVDDKSMLERLEKQAELFIQDPNLVLAGSNCINRFEDGFEREWGYKSDKEIETFVFLGTPFAHSTAIFRTDIFHELSGYDVSFKTAQDTELWMRFAKKGRITMIQNPLVIRNVHSSSISIKRRWRQFYDGFRARWMHNKGINRLRATICSVRSLMISFIPSSMLGKK